MAPHREARHNAGTLQVPRIFHRDKRAITALEYGIIAAILGVTLVGIFTSFGSTVAALFSGISSSV
jgi:Flp pilus assembly pilin Flp